MKLALVVIAFGLLSLVQPTTVGSNASRPENGTEAPQIELKSPSGKNIKLSKLRGKIVLIDFWASWCKDCIVAIPKMKELQASNPTVKYVFISSDRNIRSWKKAVKNTR